MMTAIESIRLASLLSTRDRLRPRTPAMPSPRPPRPASPAQEPSKGFVALRLQELPGEHGSEPALAVTIPFPFFAGGTALPGGAYRLRLLSRASRTAVLSLAADPAVRAMLPMGDTPRPRTGVRQIVLQRRGDHFHVAAIQTDLQ